MSFINPFTVRKQLAPEQEPDVIERRLRGVLDRLGFDLAESSRGRVIGRKGSKISTWLRGALRTPPDLLPVRVDITIRTANGTQVTIEVSDDWGFGLRTGTESVYLPHLNRILGEIVSGQPSEADRQAPLSPAIIGSGRRRGYWSLGVLVAIIVTVWFFFETLLRLSSRLSR
jgi:hypothetical protein